MKAPRPGPSPLAVVHKTFVVLVLVLAFGVAAWALRRFLRDGALADAAWAALAGMGAAGLTMYLRTLRHLGERLTAPGDARQDA